MWIIGLRRRRKGSVRTKKKGRVEERRMVVGKAMTASLGEKQLQSRHGSDRLVSARGFERFRVQTSYNQQTNSKM